MKDANYNPYRIDPDRLPDAILKGCERTEKVKGRYHAFSYVTWGEVDKEFTCALGSAAKAELLPYDSEDLIEHWPELTEYVVVPDWCPLEPEENLREMPLLDAIVALNDNTDLSREQIAEWVRLELKELAASRAKARGDL